MMIRVVLILSYLLSFSVSAENVDLTFSTDIDVSSGVEFRDLVAFSITLTNNGPDDAGTNTTFPYPNSVNSSLMNLNQNGFVDVSFIQNFNFSQPCYFGEVVLDPPPNGNVHYAYEINFPVISANSSITCYGFYHIGFESGRRIVRLKARTLQGDVDINPDNDEIEIVFGIRPKVIPIFTTLGLILIVFLFIYLAYFKLSRNET